MQLQGGARSHASSIKGLRTLGSPPRCLLHFLCDRSSSRRTTAPLLPRSRVFVATAATVTITILLLRSCLGAPISPIPLSRCYMYMYTAGGGARARAIGSSCCSCCCCCCNRFTGGGRRFRIRRRDGYSIFKPAGACATCSRSRTCTVVQVREICMYVCMYVCTYVWQGRNVLIISTRVGIKQGTW